MPIDPRIILGVKPVQFQQADPMEQYAKVLGIKNAMTQGDMQAMQLDQARQGMEEDKRVRELFAAGGVTPESLMAVAPKRGMEFAKNLTEQQKAQAGIEKDKSAANKNRFDVQMKQLEHGASILGAATPENWDTVKEIARMTNAFPDDVLARFPQQFDPNFVNGLKNAGLTMAQKLENEHKAATLRETQKQNQVVNANKPFNVSADGSVIPNVPVQQFQISKSKAGAPNVNVRTEVKMAEGLANQVGPMMNDSTQAAAGAAKQVDAAQRLAIAAGTDKIFAGPGASPRMKIAQVGQVLGVGGRDDAEKIANTRAAVRSMAELTLQGRQQMKGQGAITESEGKLAEKAMSGDIDSFTKAEIQQLAKATERAARWNYGEHMRKLEVMQSNPNLQQLVPFYQPPAIPPAAATPAPPATKPTGIKFLGFE